MIKEQATIAHLESIGQPVDSAGTREIIALRIEVERGLLQTRRCIAYGTVGADGETYSLEHAPTQEDFDAVAAALDGADSLVLAGLRSR